jgi:hypothetical protein
VNKLFLISTILLLYLQVAGQNITGIAVNINGDPINGAHVSCKGKSTGAITDNSGRFTLSNIGSCDIIVFNHVNYKSKEVSISELRVNSTVVLQDTTYIMNPVDIYSKPVIALLPDTPLFISDYEITDGHIYLCAFKNRQLGKPFLLFTDMNGKIVDSEPLPETGELYKDPDEAVYLCQKDYAFQVIPENDNLFMSEPFESRYIVNAREHWTHSMGDSLILRYYFARNQGLGYFIRQLPNDSAIEWLVYVDEEAIDRMSWGGFFDGNEFDKRFESQIVYKPIQVPVFFEENRVLAFNFISGNIEFLDSSGALQKEVNMQYADMSKIKPEIYFDSYTRKYYGREIRSGLNRIVEIDVETGKALESFSFKGYPFIEKLKIFNNVLYFLYKDYSGDEYKRLYKSPLIKQAVGN